MVNLLQHYGKQTSHIKIYESEGKRRVQSCVTVASAADPMPMVPTALAPDVLAALLTTAQRGGPRPLLLHGRYWHKHKDFTGSGPRAVLPHLAHAIGFHP